MERSSLVRARYIRVGDKLKQNLRIDVFNGKGERQGTQQGERTGDINRSRELSLDIIGL